VIWLARQRHDRHYFLRLADLAHPAVFLVCIAGLGVFLVVW